MYNNCVYLIERTNEVLFCFACNLCNWLKVIQPTISLEMPVPSQGHYGFHSFRLLTDFVCLYNYEFLLSLCKIVRSSVILLLPIFTLTRQVAFLDITRGVRQTFLFHFIFLFRNGNIKFNT
jgi:hypothetical protein